MKKNSQRVNDKTSKTDRTNNKGILKNNKFLKTLFADIPDGVRPVTVSFRGNPTHAKSKWQGNAWTAKAQKLQENANNYFSLSCYTSNKSGKYRRIKAHFYALYAIMLDDVGTKSEHESLTLKPSWLLETSKGNYQAGYILSTPIKDADLADQLMKAIIAAGLCDEGAGGPTTRLARLPVGINGKREQPFSCNLEAWNPELRYSYDDLVNCKIQSRCLQFKVLS